MSMVINKCAINQNNLYICTSKIIKQYNLMSATDIKLYDIFRNDLKLSDARAKIFAEVVQETINNEVNHQQTDFKSQIKEDFLKLEMQLTSKIEQTKSDMIKWFFTFFITLVVMILGVYATILLK